MLAHDIVMIVGTGSGKQMLLIVIHAWQSGKIMVLMVYGCLFTKWLRLLRMCSKYG